MATRAAPTTTTPSSGVVAEKQQRQQQQQHERRERRQRQEQRERRIPPTASERLVDRLVDDDDARTDRTVVDWDDGFVPSGCGGARGRMVIDQPRSRPGLVAVLRDVVPDRLATDLYESACREGVWGEYVGLDEIDDLLEREPREGDGEGDGRGETGTETGTEDGDRRRRRLAARAVRSFFLESCARLVEDDLPNVHGVAVWVIASGVGDSVQYHIDYAEMFRFQTNVIYPPMYGGTLHLTRTTAMEGGGFYAHRGGLEHYRKHRYKCPLDRLGWNGTGIDDDDGGNGNGWVEVPYRYNQGTLCDGDLPHFSAPVRFLPDGLKRVIVGFNVCDREIGPLVRDYPEHSAKFNRYVKMSQTAATASAKFGGGGGGLTVEACKSNPKLAAFVKLLARKMKENERLKQQQQQQQQEGESDERAKENNGVDRGVPGARAAAVRENPSSSGVPRASSPGTEAGD